MVADGDAIDVPNVYRNTVADSVAVVAVHRLAVRGAVCDGDVVLNGVYDSLVCRDGVVVGVAVGFSDDVDNGHADADTDESRVAVRNPVPVGDADTHERAHAHVYLVGSAHVDVVGVCGAVGVGVGGADVHAHSHRARVTAIICDSVRVELTLAYPVGLCDANARIVAIALAHSDVIRVGHSIANGDGSADGAINPNNDGDVFRNRHKYAG